MLDATTYSRKLDEVVTLLVGGAAVPAARRFMRLKNQMENVSEVTMEVNLKTALAQRVGLIKTDKFWTSFSLARQSLSIQRVA